ncbi:1-acyl-sn-glycerol-3-phosphate acyltransferase, partial [candidate division KSB1 bacterium]|nr:1-acyl-sn-glycerol-3-phosphate acyltransferase [candidate division KSB1 bacterium]NIR69401.1 1-acyl-sn-glycerol-3-phosphate acyltransferase [candidate division KSB1 bacterium]NIS22751.1 1-acyl-sn-glycerol-3-phosphate acyltransferase [candidate division KSB1 bacterium]NIT69598.1 1-acyl-sn-glycerol-3-phosphate acyltransferase [candidate division KSB1 bacterium]NIU23259.1 1-acyl-sn-glycerol-3-phosphate acyltransferase [candidate division KSB1 bacterium]
MSYIEFKRNLIIKGRRPNWLSRVTWPITQYLLTNGSVALGWLFFKVLNRTKIIGKENVPQRPNTLLLSNHQSMIDSFPVGLFAFFPRSLIKPSVMPWNPAAEENFYKNPILGWLAENWKCIPIKKGRKDVGAIFKMAEALKVSPMTLFPEGTRSRDGKIGRARGGAGMLILETRPTVIPVCVDGLNRLLPVGAVVPRLFKRIYIYYGKPIDLSRFNSQGKTKEVAQDIMNHVMDRIRSMQAEIQKMNEKKTAFQGK